MAKPLLLAFALSASLSTVAPCAAAPVPTPAPLEEAALSAFAAKLGSEKFKERAAAHSALLLAGRAALPVLREALASASAEVRFRARGIVQALFSRPLPEELLALGTSLESELAAASSAPAGPEQTRRLETLVARADASRRAIAADEIALRVDRLEDAVLDLRENDGPSAHLYPAYREMIRQRDALVSLRDLPAESRLQLAGALARGPGAEEKARARALLREALAADLRGMLMGRSRGAFFIAALEAGALEDRALVHALTTAPGGAALLDDLRATREHRRMPKP